MTDELSPKLAQECADAMLKDIQIKPVAEPEGLEEARISPEGDVTYTSCRGLDLTPLNVITDYAARVAELQEEVDRLRGELDAGTRAAIRVTTKLQQERNEARARIAELEAREVTGEMVEAARVALRNAWMAGDHVAHGFRNTARTVLNAALRSSPKEATDG